MSSITFKALIDGVHFDPKKGTVKIQLIAASHVSIDKLTTLGPRDESVQVTLESAQTKIIEDVGEDVCLPLKFKPPEGQLDDPDGDWYDDSNPSTDKEPLASEKGDDVGVKELKDAAERLREEEEG